MLIKAKVDYLDLEHDRVLRIKGQLMEVSEERGQALIEKGLVVEPEILDLREEEGPEDISKLNLEELKERLKEKGIEFNAKVKKDDLINLLQGAE